jgi:hypothetical protein
MIRKVDMERFTVTSSKPFDAVVAAIKASIGHPNMAELWQATQRATTAAELEAAIQPALGESGLMQFVEFDHGMIIRKGTENHTSRIVRLVIGNPLVMEEMAKRVPDADSYAPVTALVDERADGVQTPVAFAVGLRGIFVPPEENVPKYPHKYHQHSEARKSLSGREAFVFLTYSFCEAYLGAGRGGRTPTRLPSADFESAFCVFAGSCTQSQKVA